jgi:hypothetical protein
VGWARVVQVGRTLVTPPHSHSTALCALSSDFVPQPLQHNERGSARKSTAQSARAHATTRPVAPTELSSQVEHCDAPHSAKFQHAPLCTARFSLPGPAKAADVRRHTPQGLRAVSPRPAATKSGLGVRSAIVEEECDTS